MKQKIVFFLAAFLMVSGLKSQILEPVKWSFSQNKISDNEFELVFTASIDPKWHLYSQDIPMSPPATTFTFEKSDQYELVGKVVEESDVIEEYDPNFDMVLKYFASSAVFKQKVKVLVNKPVTVKGSLNFMCCDDTKCLPPTDVDFSFDLLPTGAEAASTPPAQKILQPVKWDITSKKTGERTIDIFFTAHIDKGYHLYSLNVPEDGPLPTEFSFEKPDGYELVGKVTEVTPYIEEYDDVFKMDIKYFVDEATFRQTIRLTSEKDVIPVVGEIAYMVCNDVGCVALYEDINLKFDGKSGELITETKPVEKQETTESAVGTSDIQGKKVSFWGFFLLSFLGGLIAIVTPCVFPMIPMTISFFMKEGQSKAKGRAQALFYGFSIILIYTFIGSVLAVVAGPGIANWLSTHWLPNVLFFLIFVIFAASFFGMFEITLPHWLVNKSDESADKGGVLGPLFMALTLVLVSFSCTGPIVGTILVESAGGHFLRPIIGMFGFSLAFALPFTFFAFFPSLLANLPKSGGWLNSVKVVLGFLELALGLKFLSIADQTYHWGILDREVYLALWIVIFAMLGFYLLGKIRFVHDSDVPYVSVPRLILAIITFSFVVYLIPGMVGAPLKALSGYLPPQTTIDFDLNAIIRNNVKLYSGSGGGKEVTEVCDTPKYHDFLELPHGLEGYFDYEQAVSCAKEQDKPIFIDFTGHGCVNCREMEANVWSDPKVLKILREDYIILALYVDDKTKLPEEEWVKSTYDGRMKKSIGKKYADFQIVKFGVNAQPFYVLLGHDGEVLAQPRAYDLDVDAFVKFLKTGLKNYKEGKYVFKIE